MRDDTRTAQGDARGAAVRWRRFRAPPTRVLRACGLVGEAARAAPVAAGALFVVPENAYARSLDVRLQ